MFFIVFGELVFLAFESKGLQSIDERYPCVLLSFGSQTWLACLWTPCRMIWGSLVQGTCAHWPLAFHLVQYTGADYMEYFVFSNDESKERSYRETVPVLYIYIYISLHWTKKNGCIFQIHQPGARWRICIGNTVTLPTSLRRGYDSHFNEGRGEPSGSWEVPGQRSSIVDGEFLHPFWRSHQMGVILVADFIHIYIYTL